MPFFVPEMRQLAKSKITSAATDIPTVTVPAGTGLLVVVVYIPGVSVAQTPLLRVGTAGALITTTTYSSWISTFGATTVTGTSRASATGIGLIGSTSTFAMRAVFLISTLNGETKTFSGDSLLYGASGITAATAMSSAASIIGMQVGTAVVDSVGVNSGGTGTLNAGAFMDVYGAPGS
jgi:hypothetical protein